jgi:hypothetical protein
MVLTLLYPSTTYSDVTEHIRSDDLELLKNETTLRPWDSRVLGQYVNRMVCCRDEAVIA